MLLRLLKLVFRTGTRSPTPCRTHDRKDVRPGATPRAGGHFQNPDRPQRQPRTTPSPAIPREQQAASTPFCTKPWTGRVNWIVDGDTIHVRRGWEVVKIRLNGLDAPELGEPGGYQAKDFMFRLLHRQSLECHPIELDNYGRTVAICYLNGRDIAAEAVKAGVALDCRVFSGGRYARFERAGAEARIGRRTYFKSARLRRQPHHP